MMNETDDNMAFPELDALLSQPLTTVADNGFTLRVMMEAEKHAARRKLMIGGLLSLAAFILSFLVPWAKLTDQIMGQFSGTAHQMISQPQLYMGLWITLGILGLVWYLDRLATVRD